MDKATAIRAMMNESTKVTPPGCHEDYYLVFTVTGDFVDRYGKRIDIRDYSNTDEWVTVEESIL